ncbi:hypothetical protein [Natronorubrum halophilum]|uniref:hypothetical protein n=1 Tax=Natronorubrum halophilum TaxID=1702106 RepID=UPI0010C16C1D
MSVKNTELLVRLPVNEPVLVRKTVDAGVRNVFPSHVDRRTKYAASYEPAASITTVIPVVAASRSESESMGIDLKNDYVANEDDIHSSE